MEAPYELVDKVKKKQTILLTLITGNCRSYSHWIWTHVNQHANHLNQYIQRRSGLVQRTPNQPDLNAQESDGSSEGKRRWLSNKGRTCHLQPLLTGEGHLRWRKHASKIEFSKKPVSSDLHIYKCCVRSNKQTNKPFLLLETCLRQAGLCVAEHKFYRALSFFARLQHYYVSASNKFPCSNLISARRFTHHRFSTPN